MISSNQKSCLTGKGKAVSNNQNRKSLCPALYCLLSAVLLILSFPKFNLEFLAWFAFVPFFFAVRGKGAVQAFKIAYLTGVLFFLGIIYWLIYVPSQIVPGGATGKVLYLIILFGLFILILYLAIYFAIFGLVISRYSLLVGHYSLLLIPSLWVILEYIRSRIFTGFGWAMLGYSQYLNLPIIQVADITGAFGVSFLVMMANVAAYSIISAVSSKPAARMKRIWLLVTGFCLLLILVYVYGRFKLKEPTPKEHLRVGIVQANIPLKYSWNEFKFDSILEKHFELTKKSLKYNPDFIIWSETAVPYYLNTNLSVEKQYPLRRIFNFAREIKRPLLTGIITEFDKRRTIYYNSAILISPEGRLSTRYDKIHLVPFGEYMPLRKYLPFLSNLVPIEDFTAGEKFSIFRMEGENLEKKAQFAVLICFEDIFAGLARNFTKKGAQFFVSITNDAWFHDSSSPLQHLQQAVFRVIENRRPMVRAANIGISCFIDNKGKIHSYVRDKNGKTTFISGFRASNIYYNNDTQQTIYTKYGDLFIILCLAFCLYGIIVKRK